MKKKYIIGTVVIIALLVVFLMWNRDSNPPNQTSDANSITTTALETNGSNSAKEQANNSRTNKTQTLPDRLPNSVAGPLVQHQREAAALDQMNVPVNLWAKVVDQYGVPLSGVKVKMSLRRWDGESGSGVFPVLFRETDAEGTFDVIEQKGDVVEFESIQKEGYRLSPKALKSLNFGRNPNPSSSNNPIIFRMWKLQTPETLISGNKFFGIVPDGRFYTIDLIKGTKTEGESNVGDLRVKITRPSETQPRTQYAWTCAVETIGGGLLESDDDLMYQAPETGYVSPYQLAFDTAQTNWTDEVKGNFYIKSREGAIFGHVELDIIAHYNDQSVFSIIYTLNANGSRNLQP